MTMDEFWKLLDGIIRNPPALLIVIIVAILVSYALAHVIESVVKIPRDTSLIVVLEILMTIVLVILVFKSFLYDSVTGVSHPRMGIDEPTFLRGALMAYTVLSMLIYAA